MFQLLLKQRLIGFPVLKSFSLEGKIITLRSFDIQAELQPQLMKSKTNINTTNKEIKE